MESLKTIEKVVEHLGGIIATKDAEIKRLREALAFYADEKNYNITVKFDESGNATLDQNPMKNGVERARRALEGEK